MHSTDQNLEINVRQACFYLTRKCNLNCSYCKVPKQKVNELSLAMIYEALHILKRYVDPEFLVLFGGEPFVHPHINEIVDKVNELGFEYTLITNGTIDNEAVIRKLRGLTLSIDRPDLAYSTDERAKTNWAMLKKYKGIVPDLVANVTVSKENINNLKRIVDQLNDLDIWTIFGLVHSTRYPAARALFRSYCPHLLLSRAECKKFRAILANTKRRHNTEMYGVLAPVFGHSGTWHCSANPRNPEYMTINSDGNMLACNDYPGVTTPLHTIFDLPKDGIRSWFQACRSDREQCQLGCFYNHELNLCYPHRNSLLHKEEL